MSLHPVRNMIYRLQSTMRSQSACTVSGRANRNRRRTKSLLLTTHGLIQRLLYAPMVIMLASAMHHDLKLSVGHRATSHADVSHNRHFSLTVIK